MSTDGDWRDSTGGGHGSVPDFRVSASGTGVSRGPAAIGSKVHVDTRGGPAYVAENIYLLDGLPEGPQGGGSTGRLRVPEGVDDRQIGDAGVPLPNSRLRQYLDLARRAAERHPYVGIVPGIRPPELSVVYRHQDLAEDGSGEVAEPVPAIGHLLDTPLKILVVTGSSGAGKSSLLNMAAARAAGAWAGERLGRHIPVRVTAAALAEAPTISHALASCVAADFRRLAPTTVFGADFFAERPLAESPWLVLVDGLDEISSRSARQDALDIIEIAGDDHRYRFVVTTRPLSAYEMRLHPVLRRGTVELLPLPVGQLTKLAEAWFIQLGVEEPQESAMQFVAEVSQAQLRDLAGNPLMATMLCQLGGYYQGRPLPTGRSGVYDQFIKLLTTCRDNLADELLRLQRIVERHVPPEQAAELVANLYDRRLELLKQLAVARCEGDTCPSLELVRRFVRKLRPRSLENEENGVWNELLSEMLRRSGVMAERGTDFVFIHRSIAEFLAADYLTRGTRRSSRTFSHMFGWNGRLRPRSNHYDPRSNASMARFLVARWMEGHRRALNAGLHALATRGGALGAEFIAGLVADGIEVKEDTVAAAREGLSRACDYTRTERGIREDGASTPLASAYALAQLRDVRGVRSLERFVWQEYYSEASVEMLGQLAGPEGIDALLRLAASDLAPERRVQCAAQIVSLADDRAPRLLTDLASVPGFPSEHQSSALDLLERYGAQVRDQLSYLALCAACHFGVRLRSAVLLIGHRDERAIPHMIALAMEPSRNAYQQNLVLSQLVRLGDPRDVDVLAAYVSNEDLDDRGRILGIRFLERLGVRGFDSLAQLGASPRIGWRIKLLISQALASARDERSAELLAQLAVDTAIDSRARFAAAELLSTFGDPRAAGLLQNICDAEGTDPQLKYETAALLMYCDIQAGHQLLAAVSADVGATAQLRYKAAELFVRSSGLEGFALLIEIARSSGDSGLLVFALDVVARWKGTTARELFGYLPGRPALESARHMVETSLSAQILAQSQRALVS